MTSTYIILQYNRNFVRYEDAEEVVKKLEEEGYTVITAVTEGSEPSYKIIELP